MVTDGIIVEKRMDFLPNLMMHSHFLRVVLSLQRTESMVCLNCWKANLLQIGQRICEYIPMAKVISCDFRLKYLLRLIVNKLTSNLMKVMETMRKARR